MPSNSSKGKAPELNLSTSPPLSPLTERSESPENPFPEGTFQANSSAAGQDLTERLAALKQTPDPRVPPENTNSSVAGSSSSQTSATANQNSAPGGIPEDGDTNEEEWNDDMLDDIIPDEEIDNDDSLTEEEKEEKKKLSQRAEALFKSDTCDKRADKDFLPGLNVSYFDRIHIANCMYRADENDYYQLLGLPHDATEEMAAWSIKKLDMILDVPTCSNEAEFRVVAKAKEKLATITAKVIETRAGIANELERVQIQHLGEPLVKAHRDAHMKATTPLKRLYTAFQRGEMIIGGVHNLEKPSTMVLAQLDAIERINQSLTQWNSERGLTSTFGTIEISKLQAVWKRVKEGGSTDNIQLPNTYPLGWTKLPPQAEYTYADDAVEKYWIPAWNHVTAAAQNLWRAYRDNGDVDAARRELETKCSDTWPEIQRLNKENKQLLYAHGLDSQVIDMIYLRLFTAYTQGDRVAYDNLKRVQENWLESNGLEPVWCPDYPEVPYQQPNQNPPPPENQSLPPPENHPSPPGNQNPSPPENQNSSPPENQSLPPPENQNPSPPENHPSPLGNQAPQPPRDQTPPPPRDQTPPPPGDQTPQPPGDQIPSPPGNQTFSPPRDQNPPGLRDRTPPPHGCPSSGLSEVVRVVICKMHTAHTAAGEKIIWMQMYRNNSHAVVETGDGGHVLHTQSEAGGRTVLEAAERVETPKMSGPNE
ncbi:uncharacterized protein BDCG_17578 [Blastomyces dermatitidis ER-3]|uniref:Uncharacterized protein n=1 Tax=Ajellomyces dermatitidis (strain ER-3 / ATCC MYA-2586) TaxID=559297 RepID=A0ABX2VZA5_AJEDR|nr:uncharacterized protein BDCG_17578 [Blastomyces dermatitidis ER-3]OAT02471.1 hypothetical protein BDCG_17578 [Blastomyces dermatitidis ER-3]